MFPYKSHGDSPLGRMGALEDSILIGVHEDMTLVEIGQQVGRSFSGVRQILKKLERDGYIEYHPGQARARQLTELGRQYLVNNGLLRMEVFRS